MSALTSRQAIVLAVLTIVWGLNWPVMKIGASNFPPLSFRALSIVLGLPVLGAALALLRVPMRIERRHWGELARLTVTNMLVWHALAILAVRELNSGRAAMLGYTMPVFAALWGVMLFGERPTPRSLTGTAAAGLAVVLLLWHEASALAGRPGAAMMMLVAAATWALGTLMLRRTPIQAPTLAISFWMTVFTAVFMTALAAFTERSAWAWPTPTVWGAIAYNAVLIFGYAHAAWFYLARSLPPLASSLSVMLIPVIGLLAGAIGLGETLHWQDGAAIVLLLAAIGSVLLRGAPAARPANADQA